MPNDDIISIDDVPCCPEVTKDPCCDRLQFTYRLENRLNDDIPVEIVIVAELERCPGPMALGDVVYSTTLLPGERVRLASSSRNTRFTYDSESEVSYKHEQASEETFYTASMDRYMSDLTINQSSSGSSSSDSSFETEGSVSNWTDAIFGRPDARVEGEFSGSASFDFVSELSRHAESSHTRVAAGVRAANSIAIGEVQTRNHAEGETESAYESSTRTIENRNRCHAVTYFAYQLVKRQTVRFSIKAVLRRVKDPAGDAAVSVRPLRPNSRVAVLPDAVLATSAQRLEVETAGRTSAAAKAVNLTGNIGGGALGSFSGVAAAQQLRLALPLAKPLTQIQRDAALKAVDEDLVKAGIIEKPGGGVSPKLQAEFGFERTFCLPTQGIVVKGCIDKCSVCEPSREKEIEIELERKRLENKLLARQIELLDQSQEYRCCPVGEAETDTDE